MHVQMVLHTFGGICTHSIGVCNTLWKCCTLHVGNSGFVKMVKHHAPVQPPMLKHKANASACTPLKVTRIMLSAKEEDCGEADWRKRLGDEVIV